MKLKLSTVDWIFLVIGTVFATIYVGIMLVVLYNTVMGILPA